MPVTVASLIAYADLRGTAIADNAATATALVRASDYIDTRLPDSADRDDARVVKATYIAAGLELATPGFFLRAFDPVAASKVITAVGEIEWTVLPGARAGEVVPTVPAIDALLMPFTARQGIGFRVIG